MDVGAIGLLKKRTLFADRPAVYILIVVVTVVTAYAYTLRSNGIFSCQADGYTPDRYLAYCSGAQFGDYEHGALWFDLEPSVKTFASSADVVFLGDSHIQFGFSTDVTNRWFSSITSQYYLLGFIFGENVVFEEEILRKLQPRAKVYVIAVNFFERSKSLPAKDVMDEPRSYYRYRAKYLWQVVHKQICGKLSVICGRRYAIFRSTTTGAYRKSGMIHVQGRPVSYEHDVDLEKIKGYSASARSFFSQLPVQRDCIILTTVPTVRANAFAYSPSIETAADVAKELGVSFVPATLDGLQTFDGSHLDQSSAERWSEAFFKVAGPQILKCLKVSSKSRP